MNSQHLLRSHVGIRSARPSPLKMFMSSLSLVVAVRMGFLSVHLFCSLLPPQV